MDFATLIGMLSALAVVVFAIGRKEGAMTFLDTTSILIVVFGTAFVVMIKFTFKQWLGAFGVAATAFQNKADDPEALITQIVELSGKARKEGMLALESVEIEYDFLKQGVQLLIDGNSREVVSEMLYKDRQQFLERQTWGTKVWMAWGEVSPAMGMIGTLVGLVQMLVKLDDPKAIGGAMAVALLTTLYGSLIANVIAIPLADKLTLRKTNEGKLMSMCIDGVLGIQSGQNPRILESMLKTYIDPRKRATEEDN
jgi:chemotaxis protein MotA